MNILVFNAGSSSLGYKLYMPAGAGDFEARASGKAHRVGVTGSEPAFIEHREHREHREHSEHGEGSAGESTTRQVVELPGHREAAHYILAHLASAGLTVDCIGHRFLHGGSRFRDAVVLNEEVLAQLELCRALAPIHNPNSLDIIYECIASLRNVPQYVVFDNAFHAALPPYAYTYPLPDRIQGTYDFRKYGFHGLSLTFVLGEVCRILERPAQDLRIVACHLGTGGSSATAIFRGGSLDTSMGYTPLPGLVMSTRCGDIDPVLAPFLMATSGAGAEELTRVFNNKSGFLGLSGFSSDIRDIMQRADEQDDDSLQMAIKIAATRIKKYIGAYCVAMGGMDALAFTDDIGVQNWRLRELVCADMGWCGIELDVRANRKADAGSPRVINVPASPVAVLTVPTDEELVIARESSRLVGAKPC